MTALTADRLRWHHAVDFPREDWGVLAISLGMIAIVVTLASGIGGAPFDPAWYLGNLRFFAMIGLIVLLGELSVRLIRAKPASPVAYIRSTDTRDWLLRRLCASLPIAAMALFMPAFSTMKSSIGMVNDFTWDSTFIAWDRAIHGADAWLLLQPVMGYPAITLAASTLYHLWFALIYVGPFVFGFYVKDRTARLRFFLSFLASWTVVGIIAATLFASVGPVFAQPILGIPDFAPQMAYLDAANRVYPIAVLDVQDQLLDWYRAGEYGLGRGITAMPSMHVALAWLYVLAMWPIHRGLGMAFGAFFIATLLSSVHLAYHYAVDGYVAVALVTLIWWIAGRAAAHFTRPDRSPETA